MPARRQQPWPASGLSDRRGAAILSPPTVTALPAPPRPSRKFANRYALVVVAVLGFASGLPLALTGQALQAWLSGEGVDIATIGFLSLVGLPYTFKFLWAPLMDRFELMPALGRRRGWLVATQLGLAAALWALAATPPKGALQAFALLAVLVAFVSASQDVVIDAYRTDLLQPALRGLGGAGKYKSLALHAGGWGLMWLAHSRLLPCLPMAESTVTCSSTRHTQWGKTSLEEVRLAEALERCDAAAPDEGWAQEFAEEGLPPPNRLRTAVCCEASRAGGIRVFALPAACRQCWPSPQYAWLLSLTRAAKKTKRNRSY